MWEKSMIKLLIVIAVIICFSAGVVVAGETGLTFIGEDILETTTLEAPGKRIEKVYSTGKDRIVIICKEITLYPLGSGDSMLPMSKKGHLVLITKDYEEIRVGDFIAVETWQGRYFHQVVEVNEGEEGKVYTTRGINNTKNDAALASEADVLGVAIAVLW